MIVLNPKLDIYDTVGAHSSTNYIDWWVKSEEIKIQPIHQHLMVLKLVNKMLNLVDRPYLVNMFT